MPQFLLLLHEDPAAARAMSAEQMQAVVERYSAWADGLAQAGRLAQGVKLADEGGRRVRRDARGGTLVSDGPYAEGKEVVAGYFVVEADDYEGAVALARECPHLEHGWVEVRAVEIA